MDKPSNFTDDADSSAPPAKRSRAAYQRNRRISALYMRTYSDDVLFQYRRFCTHEEVEPGPSTSSAAPRAPPSSCICDSLNIEEDCESENEISDRNADDEATIASDANSQRSENDNFLGENIHPFGNSTENYSKNETSDDSSDMDFNSIFHDDAIDAPNDYDEDESISNDDEDGQDEDDCESGSSSTYQFRSEDDDPEDQPFLSCDVAKLTLPLILKPGVTAGEQLPIVIAIAVRHNLTHEATLTILAWLNSITEYNGLPSTKKALWTALCRDESVLKRHLYCRECQNYVGEGNAVVKECPCGACAPGLGQNSVSFFLQISLRSQLQELLAIPGIANSLRYRFTRIKKDINAIEDIYDGKEYKKKCLPGGILSSPTNFSFTLNADGCKVAKSAKTSAWPILFQVNEFPPHERKCHILLGGVWVDQVHPTLNFLLLPTTKELQSLCEDGITWKPDGITPVTSKFVTIVCCVDTPARAALLRMTLFNGKYGCTFCYAPGRTLPGSSRRYPVDEDAACRTDQEMRTHMDQAFNEQRKTYGVKGRSVLELLPEFNLSLGVINDSMHSVYLGVTKQHVMLLLFGKANEPWYCGSPKQLALINERLMSIKPPSRIARKPREVSSMKTWKASEWRNFLLYYGLICFEGVAKKCYVDNFALICRAAYNLNKDSIKQEEVREARLLLSQYAQGFQDLFRLENMSYNVHLLNHLTDTAENWGPLWANNAFPFESWNKRLIDSVTSATARPIQIVTRFLMAPFVNSISYNPTFSKKTRETISFILHGDDRADEHAARITSNLYGLGKNEIRPPCDWEIPILHTAGYQCREIQIFKRAKISGCEYRCRGEKEETRFCNKFVYCNDVGFGEILEIVHFCCNEEHVYGLIIKRLRSNGNAFRAGHIHNVTFSNNIVFVTVNNVLNPALVIGTPNGLRAIRLANTWETD